MKAKIALVLCCVAVWPGAAGAAPTQLYGKTVTIAGSETRTFRPGGRDEIKTMNASNQYIVYVSEAGRLFVRSERAISRPGAKGSAGSKTIDTAPGGTIGVAVSSAAQFSGNTLVITQRMVSGATRITVTFDPSFSSCTVTAQQGREGDKPMVIHDRFSGENNVVLSISTTWSGCSIQSGNQFAGH